MPRQCPCCQSVMYPDQSSDYVYYRCSNCNHKVLRLSQVETVGGDSRDPKKNE